MHAHIITIGDEILIGQTIDSNSAFIGEQLTQAGISVSRISSVGDEPEDIRRVLQGLLPEEKIVIITGGLGPTRDDITREVLAKFFETPLELHQPTWERIQRIMTRIGRKATEGHRWQSYLPVGAELLPNRLGSAPGIWKEHQGRIFVSLAGVPYEMKAIMTEEVMPRLAEKLPLKVLLYRTLRTAGAVESGLAETLEDFEDNLPPELSLAYLPSPGQVRLRLTARGEDQKRLQRLLDEKTEEMRRMLGDTIFGEGKTTLEEALGQMLRERQLQFSTAESCTGGYVAHRLTLVPGSSDYFPGSLVAYSNELKRRQLGVSAQTLEQHGAVSEQCVREMVAGLLPLTGADIGLAISGIAGPGGGTPDKPVGTVWIAVGDRERMETRKLTIGKDRRLNIRFSGIYALNFVRLFLLKYYIL